MLHVNQFEYLYTNAQEVSCEVSAFFGVHAQMYVCVCDLVWMDVNSAGSSSVIQMWFKAKLRCPAGHVDLVLTTC